MTTYAVTGATGGLGGSAVGHLIDRGVAPTDIVAVVRDRERAAELAERGIEIRLGDYTDPASLRAALAGVDRLLLISSPEVGARVAQHRNVIDAAAEAGVRFIGYTSLLRADSSSLSLAPEHVATEQLLRESGIPHAVLRNGWYWENYAASVPAAIETGTLAGSAGTGRVAGASRADYAEAAVISLLRDTGGEVYELNGEQRLTYPEIASAISEISGRPVSYQDLPVADYAAALAGAGLPAPMAEVVAGFDAAASQGDLDSTDSTLVDLLGRPSTPLTEVLRVTAA